MHQGFIWEFKTYLLYLQQNYRIMKYSIAFKDLPFEPERKQVIFVENQYHERINTIIKKKYDWLKWTFKRANLEFIYLPMFFNDEEIKEKVLYYAPYLTEEIMENVELRSSHLLRYMSHPENHGKIMPSFLYAPKKEDEEWVFQGVTIDIDGSDNKITKWFEYAILDIEEEISFQQPKFSLGFPKGTNDDNLSINDDESVSETPQIEYSSTNSFWNKFLMKAKRFGEDMVSEEEESSLASNEPTPSSLDEILDEDVRDTLEDLERNIERLRLLGIPLSAISEFVTRYETVSRLRITDDLRILLPDYNNREVKMGASFKAIYFLFLNHPEGIILQQLENYHHELANYYRQAKHAKELTDKMIERINALEYPGNNNLNSILSKIKAYFRATIDEHLAKNYYIVGRPGEPYKIALDNIIIEWEDEDE